MRPPLGTGRLVLPKGVTGPIRPGKSGPRTRWLWLEQDCGLGGANGWHPFLVTALAAQVPGVVGGEEESRACGLAGARLWAPSLLLDSSCMSGPQGESRQVGAPGRPPPGGSGSGAPSSPATAWLSPPCPPLDPGKSPAFLGLQGDRPSAVPLVASDQAWPSAPSPAKQEPPVPLLLGLEVLPPFSLSAMGMSGLQNHRRINPSCFKIPGWWSFVMATLGHSCSDNPEGGGAELLSHVHRPHLLTCCAPTPCPGTRHTQGPIRALADGGEGQVGCKTSAVFWGFQDPPRQSLGRSRDGRGQLVAPREGEGPMQGAGDRQGPGLCRGEIEFGGCGKKRGKFVKVPSGVAPSVLFNLLLAEWHLPAPNLVVSLVGEERPFALKPWLRDVLRKGLVKAAQSTGAWILTSALCVGLARHVGQAVRDHSLASTSTKARVVAIGIASLGRVLHRQLLDDAQENSPVHYPTDNGGTQGPLCSLDKNHSHFILVEPAPPGKGEEPTELRLRLEKHISEQRTGYGGTSSIEIPVLCLLVNGDPSTLERISRAVEHAAPWLILAGSGGIADVIAALVNQPHLLVPQVAEKQFREKFPGEHFSWEDVVHWTELLQNITSHPHLLTVHDFEQEGSEELDTVILKALVKACKSHSQDAQDYLDELKLAVAWDRVDIAKSEIFNGDVEWKSRDLEEVMMDALVSNKPEFVRLFVDNGADVADFLTYGRLQQLYRSAPPKSLLFDLLQRKHEEGRLTLAGLGTQQAREPPTGSPAFSLHEVSRVLKDFLHDACRGLYQAVSAGRWRGWAGSRLWADTPILQERGPARRPTGQKALLDMNQRSEKPWRDLFLWAVLQNHHEMATYFWAMGQEGVAAALAACKIVKEMSHLETEAQARRALRDAKYEQLALDLFSECYRNSEERAFALLVRRNRCWSRTTCLHLATEADTKTFFAHDGVQAFLTKIWWGDMALGTSILRLLGTFFCPALVYTNLITFSEEAPLRTGPEDLQELDSLDTEKTLLCGPGGRAEELAVASRTESRRGPRAAFLLTRWRKFWGAPVTVFLGNVVMYFAFLFLFTYVLLVDFRPPPQGPSGAEVTLYFWVFTLVLEEIRQGFFTDEDTHLVKKFTLYVEDNWNKCDMVAIFLFLVGVTCRMLPSVFEAGRATLAIDFMVFTLRLIHIFAVHRQLGPKIIIVERMMKDVFFFLFFLSVWLVAYGVTTQALLHPHDGRLEWIFRRVLYRPYLQIFGQIPLDEIDEARVNCSVHPLLLEDAPSCPNLYANWLVILLLVTFLLVTNVLLMNLLIAMFSYTFQVVQGNADTFWKFQRYHLIVEYQERPALAPPFILLSHLSLVLKRLFQKEAPQKRARLERDLPEPLDQKMVTWEAVQKENFLSQLEKRRKDSGEELLRRTAHRVDFVAKYLGGLREQERRVKRLESQVNHCTVLLSSVANTLAHSSTYWNSENFGGGNPQASADHGGGLCSREHTEAGQPPSNA
ncbi:transient receptor potential cation channel subfamily M member 5 [Hippopotamus amphibius kiboko]|uniref:transient receptor potential cation channel subfamily M member 5 n=1 Tax=Hippopotamus amphibius kiboko TaxID=575201 RepID=UPI002593A3D9|nr:transient receptor potential cation channel subfamily M member 5 [Hippopotamus amphibius kiboko]